MHSDSGTSLFRQNGPYACYVCNRTFQLACRLRAHLRLHLGQKDFTCAVCGKQFALSYRLLLHMRTHTGEKPYECHSCGKTFARAHNLRQHMRSHTGEKPYGCDVCGKQYTQTKTLKEHQRIHTGERPFECATCSKRFARIDNLKVHELTHTDNKRHMCPVCGKKYADVRCFQKHIASHTTDAGSTSTTSKSSARQTPTDSLNSVDLSLNSKRSSPPYYECNLCNCVFNDVRSFRIHIDMQHFNVVQSPAAVDVLTQGLDQGWQSSSSSQDQCYFCGQCGQKLTVHVNTGDEIVLSASCGCSGGLVAVGSHSTSPVEELSFNDADELSRTENDRETGERVQDESDLTNELQLLHSTLLQVE